MAANPETAGAVVAAGATALVAGSAVFGAANTPPTSRRSRSSREARCVSIPKAFIFDLDGTLIDSAPDIAWVTNRLLERHGLRSYETDAVRLMIGGGVAKLVERAWRGREIELTLSQANDLAADFIEIYLTRACVETLPFPGAEAALKRCKVNGARIGLCTNKPYSVTARIVETLGWSDYFGAVIGGDSAPAKKPDPAPMKMALSALGATGEETIMIGDSAVDVGAARSVGARVMLISHGYSKKPVSELGADWVIDHFDQVQTVLFPEAANA
ncbi:MAG: phosphoglycolate phosphatase [Parvularculaceae bacterium]